MKEISVYDKHGLIFSQIISIKNKLCEVNHE